MTEEIKPMHLGGSAVVDGKIRYLSVSSVTKFDTRQTGGCERRWWFRYVGKLQEPDNARFKEGRDIHSQIEHYLLTGEDVLSPVARAGKHLLPKPKTVEVEKPVDGELFCANIPFVGRIDCLNLSGTILDSEGQPISEATPEIIDWKTTSDLRWRKRPAELAESLQMVGYGVWFANRFFNNNPLLKVRLSHVYFQTKKPKAEKVSTVVSVGFLLERWQKTAETVERMTHTAQLTSADEAEPNYDACSAFSGCPYRAQCSRPTHAVIDAAFTGDRKMSSFLDKLNARLAPQPAQPPAAQTAPAVLALEAEEKALKSAPASVICACGDTLLEPFYEAHAASCDAAKKRAIAAFAPQPAPQSAPAPVDYGTCSDCAAVLTNRNASKSPRGKITHIGCSAGAGLLRPDAPTSEGKAAGVAIPHATPGVPAAAQAASDAAHNAPDSANLISDFIAAIDRVAPQPAPAAEAEPVKRRGRPRKTPAEAPKSASAPASASEGSEAPKTGSEAPTLLLLGVSIAGYGACGLEPLAVVPLESRIAATLSEICEHFKVSDPRLGVEKPLSFGGWRGVIAAAVSQWDLDAGAIYTLSNCDGELMGAFVESLRLSSHFDAVISGR